MNPRHNEIAPLYTSSVNSPRFQSPPSNSNGGIRGGTPRPRHQRSSPRVSPYPQFPLTHRPPMGSPMYQPSSPPVFPFGSLPPPMSPAPWLSYYMPPAPVANYNVASHSLPPCMRPITFAEYCGRTPPKYVRRRRRNRDDNVSSGSSSLSRPQSTTADRMMKKPIEMPVCEMPNESHGVADDVTNVSLTDYMDPDKIFYVHSEDDLEIIFPGDSEDVKSSSGSEMINSNLSGHESPNLPPSPGNHQRISANPESSSARRVQELEERSTISALEDENKQLRIGANGLQEQLSPRNDNQLELASGELMLDISGCDMSIWDSLYADILFDPSQFDQQPQTNLDFNEHII